MLHAKSLAVLVAWDMYREITEGTLDPDWADSHPMNYYAFRDVLSKQMLEYAPASRKFPGDELMRVSTQHTGQRNINDDEDNSSGGK